MRTDKINDIAEELAKKGSDLLDVAFSDNECSSEIRAKIIFSSLYKILVTQLKKGDIEICSDLINDMPSFLSAISNIYAHAYVTLPEKTNSVLGSVTDSYSEIIKHILAGGEVILEKPNKADIGAVMGNVIVNSILNIQEYISMPESNAWTENLLKSIGDRVHQATSLSGKKKGSVH